jgi:hypothetical protein
VDWLRRFASASADEVMIFAPMGLASAAIAVTAVDVLVR